MGIKLILVLLDNRGFGCINRLQAATGGAPFNNLLADTRHEVLPEIDFVAHARSLGAHAEKVESITALAAALDRARVVERSTVIVIDTEPRVSHDARGAWRAVAGPQTSDHTAQPGRASGREEVGQYLSITVAATYIKKNIQS